MQSDRAIVKRYLKPYFGRLPLGDIDALRVDAFKACLRQKKHHAASPARSPS